MSNLQFLSYSSEVEDSPHSNGATEWGPLDPLAEPSLLCAWSPPLLVPDSPPPAPLGMHPQDPTDNEQLTMNPLPRPPLSGPYPDPSHRMDPSGLSIPLQHLPLPQENRPCPGPSHRMDPSGFSIPLQHLPLPQDTCPYPDPSHRMDPSDFSIPLQHLPLPQENRPCPGPMREKLYTRQTGPYAEAGTHHRMAPPSQLTEQSNSQLPQQSHHSAHLMMDPSQSPLPPASGTHPSPQTSSSHDLDFFTHRNAYHSDINRYLIESKEKLNTHFEMLLNIMINQELRNDLQRAKTIEYFNSPIPKSEPITLSETEKNSLLGHLNGMGRTKRRNHLKDLAKTAKNVYEKKCKALLEKIEPLERKLKSFSDMEGDRLYYRNKLAAIQGKLTEQKVELSIMLDTDSKMPTVNEGKSSLLGKILLLELKIIKTLEDQRINLENFQVRLKKIIELKNPLADGMQHFIDLEAEEMNLLRQKVLFIKSTITKENRILFEGNKNKNKNKSGNESGSGHSVEELP